MCLVKNKFLNVILKRLFDLISSVLLLFLLSPLILIIAVLIKFDSQGQFYFGLIGLAETNVFYMPKFRSML